MIPTRWRFFTFWEPYAVVGGGFLGIFLGLNAFHSGPINASQAALVTVDPLVSIAIGIGLFGDRLRTSGARGPVESIALMVLIAGVLLLAHSPLVASVKSEEAE